MNWKFWRKPAPKSIDRTRVDFDRDDPIPLGREDDATGLFFTLAIISGGVVGMGETEYGGWEVAIKIDGKDRIFEGTTQMEAMQAALRELRRIRA